MDHSCSAPPVSTDGQGHVARSGIYRQAAAEQQQVGLYVTAAGALTYARACLKKGCHALRAAFHSGPLANTCLNGGMGRLSKYSRQLAVQLPFSQLAVLHMVHPPACA